MRCPRCRREIADPAPAFCRACGSPLRLEDEPAPPPLKTSLDIDRRVAGRPEADDTFELAAPAGGGGPADRAALDGSGWELGADVPRAGAGPGTIAAPAPPGAPAAPRAVPEADADVAVDALEIHVRRARPWRRVAAGALDLLPFAAGGIALARWLVRAADVGLPAPATGLDGFLDLVARERVIVLSVSAAVALALGVYATLAHALAGATLGKRLLGLRVVGPDGARPSLGRSAARSALIALSAGLLGLGLLLPLFTRSGRALHDFLARTWVVERP